MGPEAEWRHDSRKLRSFFDRDGCRSLRSALASIWRIRSRVTAKSCPTSSSVCSQPSDSPKRSRSTFSSRGVSVLRTLFVCSRSESPMMESTGDTTCLSSMKSPRWLSSSSPIGVSSEMGSCAIFRTFRTLSTGTSILVAISSGVGSRPSSWTSWREVRMSLLIVSIMCTGMRIVRAWSAMARVMAWRIHQVITRAIADQARTIRIPVHMIETINKLIRTSRQLVQELGREPTPEEIATKMEVPVDKVRKVLKIAQEPISLETPIGEEEDSHLGDFIEDKQVVSPVDSIIGLSLREQTNKVLNTLTPREEKVLRLRFGLSDGCEHTLEEVGQDFAVTRERIRQIEAKALRKLRHPSRSKKLRSFLES